MEDPFVSSLGSLDLRLDFPDPLNPNGVGRRERMKLGKGTKDRDERSRGIEIRMTDTFTICQIR